jgi:hypothetical protein
MGAFACWTGNLELVVNTWSSPNIEIRDKNQQVLAVKSRAALLIHTRLYCATYQHDEEYRTAVSREFRTCPIL